MTSSSVIIVLFKHLLKWFENIIENGSSLSQYSLDLCLLCVVSRASIWLLKLQILVGKARQAVGQYRARSLMTGASLHTFVFVSQKNPFCMILNVFGVVNTDMQKRSVNIHNDCGQVLEMSPGGIKDYIYLKKKNNQFQNKYFNLESL